MMDQNRSQKEGYVFKKILDLIKNQKMLLINFKKMKIDLNTALKTKTFKLIIKEAFMYIWRDVPIPQMKHAILKKLLMQT